MPSSRCAVCKHFRRKCQSDCIFSPYFPPTDPQRFACVHEIYGTANISKILQQVPVDRRAHTVESLYFEAQCRKNDPVYGSVGVLSSLQQEIFKVQTELAKTQAGVAFYSSSMEEQQKQQQQHHFCAVAAPVDLSFEQLPYLPSS
ncbi:hypothetical protein Leryth_025690 [Lithospermum erythrorhizon]|nr:hypothetical protein Leryth_025690 [Lithospermum erythrorhizon]